MKKLKRLVEIKRQVLLARNREQRTKNKIIKLLRESDKVVGSFTQEELKLYKDRIDKAYPV